MKLLEFDLSVEYRPASRLAHVDALSRAPLEPPKEHDDGVILAIDDTQNDWLLARQLRDEWLLDIIEVLKGDCKSLQDQMLNKDYKLINH